MGYKSLKAESILKFLLRGISVSSHQLPVTSQQLLGSGQ